MKPQQFLLSINKDLTEVKKTAEENTELGKEAKEVVESKVKELKKKIGDMLSEEESWGVVKIFLKESLKDLNQLKDEVKEPEVVTPIITEPSSGDNLVVSNEIANVELAKWRMLFRNKTPEEAYEELKEVAKFMGNQHTELVKLQETASKVKSDSPDFLAVASNIRSAGESYAQLGSKLGHDSGLGIFLGPTGGLIGAGIGMYQGTLEAGAYFADKGIDVSKDLAVKTGDNLTDITKNISNNTASVAKSVVKAISDTKIKVNVFGGLFSYEDLPERTEITKEQVAATRQEIKEKNELIKELKEQLQKKDEEKEKQIKELRERRDSQIKEAKEEKEKQIKRLEREIDELREEKREFKEKIKDLESQLKTAQNNLIAEIQQAPRVLSPLSFDKQ